MVKIAYSRFLHHRKEYDVFVQHHAYGVVFWLRNISIKYDQGTACRLKGTGKIKRLWTGELTN